MKRLRAVLKVFDSPVSVPIWWFLVTMVIYINVAVLAFKSGQYYFGALLIVGALCNLKKPEVTR